MSSVTALCRLVATEFELNLRTRDDGRLQLRSNGKLLLAEVWPDAIKLRVRYPAPGRKSEKFVDAEYLHDALRQVATHYAFDKNAANVRAEAAKPRKGHRGKTINAAAARGFASGTRAARPAPTHYAQQSAVQ